MDTRKVVAAVLSLIPLSLLGCCCKQARHGVSPVAGELGIFDAHSHNAAGLDLNNVIVQMDRAGVRKVVLFSRRRGKDADVLELHAKYPERVVPAISFQNRRWLTQDPSFLGEVELRLKSGRFRWMGELLLKHYGVPELDAPDFDISPDTALFRSVLDLSARYGVPLTIHHEAEPGNIEIFRRALRHNPAAIVVWAHWCGRATPDTARDFLRQFPNLYCDLASTDNVPRFGHPKNPLVTPDGVLEPHWRAVIEEFPGRFLAAIDAVEPSDYDNHYREWVAELRDALAGLPDDIRERVAFANAERLLAR